MAVVDYYGIEQAIQSQIDAYAGVSDDTIIEIEKLPAFDPVDHDWIGIYMDDRDAPANLQRIRAGSSIDYEVHLSIWVFAFHNDDVSLASKHRDDLLGQVELALIDDRTLGSTVQSSWISGGRFNRLEDNGFWSGAEIRLTARVQATV